MATISTKDYLLDQAKRRLKPTAVTIPGMGLAEKRLRKHEFKQFVLAEPPADSGLKPAMGDSGLPIITAGSALMSPSRIARSNASPGSGRMVVQMANRGWVRRSSGISATRSAASRCC